MVAHIAEVFTEYKQRVRRMQKVPRFPHALRMLRSDDAPKWSFFYSLFNAHPMAIAFL